MADPVRSGDVDIRLSDQDREQAVALLNQAVADGRISWTEHGERVRSTYQALTRAELAVHLADLGGVQPAVPPQRVRALASKIHSTPDRPRPIEAGATFGAVVLDLSSLPPGEHRVVANSFCGKIVILVDEDAVVVDEGSAVLGKRVVPGPPEEPNGVVVRLTGRSTLGKVTVFREGSSYWHWSH
ncbi:DUF1707 SHOCT-like domain-containing protein [Goodfellowiella coeruleoviolacea]|uniref:DUF1707 domain-containing protein n=1 Tax=Goodfellowiella coeruleoviolacea TaxID=334858 RepID=A0AAE3GAN7_9PSEU|nr:DUF1707 domain-containing protein [Goodfellowiella coeruleoviolacea]MCP2163812.1 protein of unknown function (DUF1707) [Goodfellowiella coeruleoviolacea]